MESAIQPDAVEFALAVAERHADLQMMGRSMLTVDLFTLGALIDRANQLRAAQGQAPWRPE